MIIKIKTFPIIEKNEFENKIFTEIIISTIKF